MNNNSICSQVNKIKDINLLISPPRKSQIILKINLEKGKTENINIYQNSNPEEIAYNFCLKNNLDFESVKNLINQIKHIKENNFISDKENISLSTNMIKTKKSCQSLGSYILKNNKIVHKKNIIYNSNNSIKNNIIDENENNRKNKENYTNNKILINSNIITPIDFASNYSKNNLDNTTESNLNVFNFLSPKEENKDNDKFKDKLTNNNSSNIYSIINDNNIDLDYSKKTSKENSDNNSIYINNFKNSINNKLNNLEKAYSNFNQNNKNSETDIKNISNSAYPVNTKEIINEAINDCLDIIEKEENINNKIDETITNESIYSIEGKDTKIENKKISNEINIEKAENNESKSNLIDKNELNVNINLKNSYITPKDKKLLNVNVDKFTEDNNNNINIVNDDINLLRNSLISKNTDINNDNKSINDKFFENKDEKMKIEKDIEIKDHRKTYYPNNNKLIPKIQKIYNNTINNENTNKNIGKNSLNINNNYNLDYYDTQYENNNNINLRTIDNNIIKNEINFSLFSPKNNFTLSRSQKHLNDKKTFRRVLQKNYTHYRSYRNKEKNFEIPINTNHNSIKDNINSNNSSYNNIIKDSLLSEQNILNIKQIKNFSSIKTIPNYNDNEKKIIYSPFKTDKSLKKCCLLSFTLSEKNMFNKINKNSKNKDNINDLTTATSIGNYTNMQNYSTITRGSANLKLINHKNLINYNILNKNSLNHTCNFSNEFIIKSSKEKEKNNSYYNNTINNSYNLYPNKYANNKISIKNKKRNYIFKVNKNKNKGIIVSSKLNLNNSIKTNYSSNKDNSPDYLIHKTKSNLNLHYKTILQMKSYQENKYYGNGLNNLTKNLLAKKEIMNSLKNIFYFISKNNKILDVFAVVNRKNIPEKLYDIIKTIVKNCDKKKRFIEYDEFINQAFYLFDSLSKEEKITILNFNQIN